MHLFDTCLIACHKDLWGFKERGSQNPKGLTPSSRTKQIVKSGYTLETQWTEGKPLQTIQKGGWGYVILQEQSQRPVFEQPKFFKLDNLRYRN